MTAILREDPQEPSAQADISPALDRIVRHCLEKNPIERFQTARDVAFALDSLSGSSSGASQATVTASTAATRGSWRERSVWLSLVALLTAALAWLALGRKPPQAVAPSPPVYRAVLPLPEGISLSPTTPTPLLLALSPDGRRVAFVGTRDGRSNGIWELSTATGEAREIPGADHASGPIWFADSKSLAFGTAVGMKRANVDTGAPVAISQSVVVGDSNAAGDLVGSSGPPDWKIRLISTRDGKTTDLLKPTTEGERLDSAVVPAGRQSLLVRALEVQRSNLPVSSLDAPQTTSQLSVGSGTNIHYANGAVVFATTDRIVAQPFDLQRMQPTGESVTIAEHVNFATERRCCVCAVRERHAGLRAAGERREVAADVDGPRRPGHLRRCRTKPIIQIWNCRATAVAWP